MAAVRSAVRVMPSGVRSAVLLVALLLSEPMDRLAPFKLRVSHKSLDRMPALFFSESVESRAMPQLGKPGFQAMVDGFQFVVEFCREPPAGGRVLGCVGGAGGRNLCGRSLAWARRDVLAFRTGLGVDVLGREPEAASLTSDRAGFAIQKARTAPPKRSRERIMNPDLLT